jgi:hypothetical protein
MLAREFESEEKFVMAYSREGVPMVKRWRKGAVHPGMRIRVVRMGGLGRTRAERQDNLLLLWQNGIIKDPDLMAELMDVPIPSFTNARANDMRKARAENILMADGKAVVPGSWENHAIHIREHNEYRKTFEFDALGIDAKRRFEFHVERHKALQIQAALELATLQRAAQGIPPGAGAPGGPPAPGAPTSRRVQTRLGRAPRRPRRLARSLGRRRRVRRRRARAPGRGHSRCPTMRPLVPTR